LRIIGGKYRGRKINPLNSFSGRPTTDFAREALFNILSNRIEFGSVSVLDLFAGTGSVGFEFVSRGAAAVHFVEKEVKHIAGIRKVVSDLEIRQVNIMKLDVRSYLNKCRYKYDIVFADPPFDLPWLGELPDLVFGSGVVRESGLFILEHPGSISFDRHSLFFEHRHYGRVNFSFFRLSAS
jgi:16S rRNA (guanine966-N2)-methyltransferase